MNITADENFIKNGSKIFAVFIKYTSYNRCVKCCFQTSDTCFDVPCNSEERKDGIRGFWRAANVPTSEFILSER